MISRIKMSKVASFDGTAEIETDKRVNLVYGLNGTGKTTISDYLYKSSEAIFSECSTEFQTQLPVVVYNQSFIQDHFFEADSLKGIFSLSRENKAAKEKIKNAQEEQAKLGQLLSANRDEWDKAKKDLEIEKTKCEERIWAIKRDYCGGDRVLEYCLEGLKGKKETLLNFVMAIQKPDKEPTDTIPQLKKSVEALRDSSDKPVDELPTLSYNAHSIETDPILGKVIVGDTESVVAPLIEKLQNSDWVKDGLQYIPEVLEDEIGYCPFCQKPTLTADLLKEIRDYFDDAYEEDIAALRDLADKLSAKRERIPDASLYLNHELLTDTSELENLYGKLIQALDSNANELQKKILTPSTISSLTNSEQLIESFNDAVRQANDRIRKHNEWVADRKASLEEIKRKFWYLMRWKYDSVIERFEAESKALKAKVNKLDMDAETLNSKVQAEATIITEAQKETVNTDEAVSNINARLIDIGIEDFSIRKHSDSLYRIVRQGQLEDVFHTLSEGEKMVISFLYFCEFALGKISAADTEINKIVVIDDPISSLSHVHIFNVGQLIKTLFFGSDRFKQVFVLTHSLYFFYEMTDPNHDRRKENQKLFRITKNASGSHIRGMKYEEIQNDYQAYWSIVNDCTQPPALLANCMRNIIEYFFNFVKRRDLNNVFQLPEFQGVKYQAFCRYVNRESHSLGQNIFDLKEFDYEVFREGLYLVFEKAGYPEHYEVMAKVK